MASVVLPDASAQLADSMLSLTQALMSFEDALTNGLKREYQKSQVIPNTASIIAFIAHIDTNNDTTTRCVGARLYTFLDATQQFCRILGTFVNANPKIAALTWGAVSTAIVSATSVASSFEEVTRMMMAIGKLCPTYQQYGPLHPNNIGLQRALCDFYSIIIRFCLKIIEISRLPATARTSSPIFGPSESDFQATLDELNQAVEEIQHQRLLPSMQADQEAEELPELESQGSTIFRQVARDCQREITQDHVDKHQWQAHEGRREASRLKFCIGNNLSTIDHAKPWKQAMQKRVPATAEWLHQESVFLQWKCDRDSVILWCSGKLGMGKTVLVANTVARLHATCNANDIISYFFCTSENEESLSARSIFGSIARQILEYHIQHTEYDELLGLYNASQNLDTFEVIEFLLSHLQAEKTYYMILDGLDECSVAEARRVMFGIHHVCRNRTKGLKILISSRPEFEDPFIRVIRPEHKVSLTGENVESDMDRYISLTLGRCLEEKQLKVRDPKLIVRISEALKKGSDGS